MSVLLLCPHLIASKLAWDFSVAQARLNAAKDERDGSELLLQQQKKMA